jgi:hypothetical protein
VVREVIDVEEEDAGRACKGQSSGKKRPRWGAVKTEEECPSVLYKRMTGLDKVNDEPPEPPPHGFRCEVCQVWVTSATKQVRPRGLEET